MEDTSDIPPAKHPLSQFIISICPHCKSKDLVVMDAGIAGYHPGGDWVVVSYKVFCNNCKTVTEGSESSEN